MLNDGQSQQLSTSFSLTLIKKRERVITYFEICHLLFHITAKLNAALQKIFDKKYYLAYLTALQCAVFEKVSGGVQNARDLFAEDHVNYSYFRVDYSVN